MPEITLLIGKEFPTKVIPLIREATKSIDIIVFDWRWYPDQIGSTIQQFNHEIIKAARKNRQVRAIINSKKIAEPLTQNKIKAKVHDSKQLLHTKLMIIDGRLAILGSHNYTMNAFTINHEISAIIQNEEIVKRLKTYFENLWQ